MSKQNKINKAFTILLNSRHTLSIEEMGRRKLFVVFFLSLIIPLIIFGTFYIKKGMYHFALANYGVTMILIILLVVLSFQKNGRVIYRIAAIFLELLLFYWTQTGIGHGYGSIWSLAFPPFAFFLLGRKEGFLWTFICTLFTVIIFTNPFSFFTDFPYDPQFFSRHLLAFFMICLGTYSYESVREKYKSAMEAEQAKLLIEKEKLSEAIEEANSANRLMKLEMKMREQAEIELRAHHDQLEEMVAERTLEIKKNIENLKSNQKRYQLMSDNVNDLIWATDMNMNFTFISPSVSRIFGYTVEEAFNLPHDKWNTPESYEKLIKSYLNEMELEKSGNPNSDLHVILQLDQIKKDGSVFSAELKVSFIRDESGKAIGIVGITRDISDRISMEQEREKIKEQLAQSQKMEALGTLVGGLAHDFNNFLAGIIGSFDLVSHALKKENLIKREYIEKYLNLGLESSKRSAGLIDQLLILSKKHEIKLTPLDINNSISHIFELCRNSFPKSVELNFRSLDTPLIIKGDMLQIEQVLLNLCINASHAMTIMRSAGEKAGGTLTLTAEKVKSDYIMKENYPEEAGIVDTWIRIQVSDTGIGIDNDTKQRIFEPFFSTKNKNESTGLGLAISYNIIKKHNGIINVYSEPGSGSCFSLYFPSSEDSDKVVHENDHSEILYGSGTVLVIDDEPVVLAIAKGFLEQCGYSVITAEGADNGIKIFTSEHSWISAVLIDLSMPGKTGLEVFQELKKIDPDVKAILSSGMLESESKEMALGLGVKETLNKPYLAVELSIKMKSVISES